jgi:hypothetical protein
VVLVEGIELGFFGVAGIYRGFVGEDGSVHWWNWCWLY